MVDPRHPPQTAWEQLTLASLALDAALDGQPVSQVVDLASRVVGRWPGIDAKVQGQAATLAALAFLLIDRLEQAGTC